MLRACIIAILIVCSLSLVGLANATPLEDAVAQYNTSAGQLADLWNDFQDKQSAAFDDAKDYFENMYVYFDNIGTDNTTAEAAWDAMEDAMTHLEEVTVDPVDPAFTSLLEALQASAGDLQKVIALDALSSTETAYNTNSDIFQVTEQPFVFWNDPTLEGYDNWFEFTYPGIAVGDNSHASITSSSVGDWIQWIAGLLNPYAGLQVWLIRVHNAAQQIVDPAVSKLQELCDYCIANTVTSTTFDDCFTQGTVNFWCSELVEDCGETDPFKANQDLSEKWSCWQQRNLGAVGSVAVGEIKPPWVDTLDFVSP